MHERLQMMLDELGMKKSEFARKLNLSQSFVSEICSGKNNPSDRTISDICREFGISEVWLRTGEGPMKLPQSEDEEFQRAVADIQLHDERMKEALKFYWRLSPEKKAFVWETIDGLSGK